MTLGVRCSQAGLEQRPREAKQYNKLKMNMSALGSGI